MKQEVKDVQDSGYEIGYTIGNSKSDFFSFVMSPDSGIMKWEYVYIEVNKEIILGRIEDLISKSDLLTDHLDYGSIRRYTDTGINDAVDICEVGILGIPGNGNIKRSRYLIRAGIPVRRATKDILGTIFRVDDEKALNIGHLTDNPEVDVSADINGLRRHLAIIAQTGAGKSHTAGVIMEEILKKGGSIIVIDPHADYVLMKNSKNPLYRERIKVFRTPLSTGRYMDRLGKVSDFTIRFQDLNPDEVSEVMGVKENYTNLSKIVKDAFEKMSGSKDVDEFISRAEKIDSEGKIAARIKYLRRIRQIFGSRSTDVSEYLSPSQLSVIDLSGLDQSLANYFAYRVISQSYDMKTSSSFEYPVFIFIEEAHNFVPAAKNKPGGVSGLVFDQIRKIASEGRKFGIFLVVITQRPGKIDQDVLSQCNSQIILRVTNPGDQRAILESSENISERLMNDLPSLDTGEAILVGEIVKMPVIAKIRERETDEGGSDVDITELLKRSREEAEKRENPEDIMQHARKLVE